MASSEAPQRRKFLPQPVETTARSSKRQHLDKSEEPTKQSTDIGVDGDKMVSIPKPRKFLPQPVEETTRSSRRKNVETEKPTDSSEDLTNGSSIHTRSDDSTNSSPTTSKPSTSSRRFAPEPVETTARSSRRKFAVEPVETSTKSNRGKANKEKDESPTRRPRRKFAPEPVETTTVRRRRRDADEDSNESPPDSPSETSSRVSSRQSTGSRRFSPELIETAEGSFRHRKESGSPRKSSHNLLSDAPPPSEPAEILEEPEDPCESRFSAANLAKRHHEAHRQHSYCVPNLPIIESEGSSDEDEPPSLTESPSSTDNELHKMAKIEEVRESYTDYVLSLSSSNERRKLEEQAMAAYINEVPHQPVAHFAGDEEEDEDLVHVGTLSAKHGADPKTFRRSSQADLDWEMQNMRRHHEQLERAKRELHEDTAGASRFSAAALAARHHLGQVHKQPVKTQKQKDEDAEYAKMKKAASPPMLGEDIVFPYTISPKMTRCDVDQAPRPRRADSDDERMSVDSGSQSLWSAQSNSQNKPGAGLWMGLCQKAAEPSRPTTPTRSGIQTPAFESPNPFESHTPRGARTPGRRGGRPLSGMHMLALTPSRGEDDFTSSIDKKLQIEKQIEEEFTPRVITQIYNYLSLGFPSLARDFDTELSKISRISIKELRKDDHITQGTIKGYLGAPESDSTWEEDEDGTVRGCRRWEALRLYVKEWARQSPNFTVDSLAVPQDPSLAHLKSVKTEAWGATVRKGSWAQ